FAGRHREPAGDGRSHGSGLRVSSQTAGVRQGTSLDKAFCPFSASRTSRNLSWACCNRIERTRAQTLPSRSLEGVNEALFTITLFWSASTFCSARLISLRNVLPLPGPQECEIVLQRLLRTPSIL